MKKTKGNVSLSKMVLAIGSAIAVTLALAAAIAGLVITEHIQPAAVKLLCALSVYCASLLGGIIVSRGGEGLVVARIGIVEIAYFLLLIGTGILFLDCTLGSVWINGLCILMGYVSACAIYIIAGRTRPHRKKVFW